MCFGQQRPERGRPSRVVGRTSGRFPVREGPVAWRVDRRFQGVLHAIKKSLTRASQRMYVRTEHIWDRCPISLECLGLAASPRGEMVGCLGCDNPFNRRPAASGCYRYRGPAIT